MQMWNDTLAFLYSAAIITETHKVGCPQETPVTLTHTKEDLNELKTLRSG